MGQLEKASGTSRLRGDVNARRGRVGDGHPRERKWEGEDRRLLTLFEERPGALWGWSGGVKGRLVQSGWSGGQVIPLGPCSPDVGREVVGNDWILCVF